MSDRVKSSKIPACKYHLREVIDSIFAKGKVPCYEPNEVWIKALDWIYDLDVETTELLLEEISAAMDKWKASREEK